MLIILSVCNYSCLAQLSVLFSPRSDRHIVEEQVLNSLRITDVKLGITNPMCLDTIWGVLFTVPGSIFWWRKYHSRGNHTIGGCEDGLQGHSCECVNLTEKRAAGQAGVWILTRVGSSSFSQKLRRKQKLSCYLSTTSMINNTALWIYYLVQVKKKKKILTAQPQDLIYSLSFGFCVFMLANLLFVKAILLMFLWLCMFGFTLFAAVRLTFSTQYSNRVYSFTHFCFLLCTVVVLMHGLYTATFCSF